MKTSKSEIESMLYLLEDPDQEIRNEVLNRFYSLGDSAVPLLDECRIEAKDETTKKIANDLLLDINFPSIYQEFFELYSEGLKDFDSLEKGILLLCRIGFPTLRISTIKKDLDLLANDIFEDVMFALDEEQQMSVLLNYVFYQLGFDGSKDELFKSEFSFMNVVLLKRKGIPLSLSMIVLSLAHRLELPFFGVNMPMHFVLMYEINGEPIYIDPFQKGKIISRKELLYFLGINGLEANNQYFRKASFDQMLVRTMRNLSFSYEKEGNEKCKEKVNQLIELHNQFFPSEIKS